VPQRKRPTALVFYPRLKLLTATTATATATAATERDRFRRTLRKRPSVAPAAAAAALVSFPRECTFWPAKVIPTGLHERRGTFFTVDPLDYRAPSLATIVHSRPRLLSLSLSSEEGQ